MARIHILVGEADKARYRRQAEREGKSLGAWLREAAEDRLAAMGAGERFRQVDELDGFFAECDAREARPEPDWTEHLRVIEGSLRGGTDPT